MRSRIAVLAAGTVAFAVAAFAGIAGAVSEQDPSVTIHVAPAAIQAGDRVLIYGRLRGSNRAHRPIRLYQRIDPKPSYSPIQTTRTDSAGRYEFVRLREIVNTNRSWYVLGPDGSHTRSLSERVGALVTMAPSAPAAVTGHAIVFSGHVTPTQVGERVLLQVQQGSSDRWTTVA